MIRKPGVIPAQVRYCTVRYWVLFQKKGIFCGNRKILARMRSFVVMTELLFM